MFKKASKLALSLLLLCTHADAQWLKKFESSDNLYQEAKREIDLKHYQKAIAIRLLIFFATSVWSKYLEPHLATLQLIFLEKDYPHSLSSLEWLQ